MDGTGHLFGIVLICGTGMISYGRTATGKEVICLPHESWIICMLT
jgi:N-acetylglucosamine kinase-like BadF-type ATPase